VDGHELFFSSTLENDDLIVVSRQGLHSASVQTGPGFKGKTSRKTEFKIYRYAPDLKLKWEVKFLGHYPKIIPAGGGAVLYVIDSISNQKTTTAGQSAVATHMLMKAYDDSGSLMAKKTFSALNLSEEPSLFLADGLDLIALNIQKRKAKRAFDLLINRIQFGAFSFEQTTVELPEEYNDIYWSEWRYIGETEENLLFATRKKIDGGRRDNWEENHQKFEVAMLRLHKDGKKAGPIIELSLKTNPDRYLKPNFAANAFPNRDLTYLAWKVQPIPFSEFGQGLNYEEKTGFNTGLFQYKHEYQHDQRVQPQNNIQRPEWSPKDWGYGNLWLNPKDNKFYFYALTGPSVSLAGLKASHDGYVIAQFNMEGELQWKTEEAFSKEFMKFGYFRIHAPVGKRELDLQSQNEGKLVFTATSRVQINKKGACYLTYNPDGKMTKETVALEKDQLLFKQPLGFPRIYRWKNYLYFHSLNSKGEFIVYSKSGILATSAEVGQREVVIERYE
jgi:hypothetical protein